MLPELLSLLSLLFPDLYVREPEMAEKNYKSVEGQFRVQCDGSIWEENGRGEVAGIFVSYTEDIIQSLQFLFFEDGNFVQSNKHGSPYCGNFSAVLLDYPSEFLTSISGSYVNNGGNPNLFGGFHGTKSDYAAEGIGIYVKPVVSSMINLKDLRVKDEK
ncbi:hypothetical protein MTR67_041236 [Solanum verrucosum]|uniref:Jacalin-type lectin domain-containing protein n=1 Tax=Solanum verrucosum TaxID=315347 RepID=A0AAF0ZQL6_SOLVR|nr:hypothetical protein MTR67_041236 [Solanum verrucosum]